MQITTHEIINDMESSFNSIVDELADERFSIPFICFLIGNVKSKLDLLKLILKEKKYENNND